MQALLDARTEKDDQISWTAEETGVYSTGSSAAIETTGLAAQALLKWGQASETVRKALNFLSSKKDASGTWGTTQATIMALRAILLPRNSAHPTFAAPLMCCSMARPQKPSPSPLTTTTSSASSSSRESTPQACLGATPFRRLRGPCLPDRGPFLHPWEEKPATEPLSIDIAYDRTRLFAERYSHRDGDDSKQPQQDRKHGYGGPGHSTGLRPAERRPAIVAPGKSFRGPTLDNWRSSALLQPRLSSTSMVSRRTRKSRSRSVCVPNTLYVLIPCSRGSTSTTTPR